MVRYYVDVQANELGSYPPVESAANIMRSIIYSNAGQLSASMICSGWDPYKGYQIYSVNQTGFEQEGDWALSGSGSTFLWGYFDANYRNDFTFFKLWRIIFNWKCNFSWDNFELY